MELSLKTNFYWSMFAVATVATSLYAAESKANTLLYISPNDYNHSVYLSHTYYGYWFEQGPLVESIAFQALKVIDSGVALCKANETSDTVIRINPSIFYNWQMGVYHSRLVATVYSGNGNLLGTYSGEAQQRGFLGGDTVTPYYLTKVYTSAMQNLMTKLKINPALDNEKAGNRLPCGLIGAQPEPKFSFY